MANNLTDTILTPVGVATATYTTTGAGANAIFLTATGSVALSAGTALDTPPISGAGNYRYATLAFTLGRVGAAAATGTLSASTLNLSISSNVGVFNYAGSLTTSSYTSATSAFNFTVSFADPTVESTVLSLSGLIGSTPVLLISSTFDNLYQINPVDSTLVGQRQQQIARLLGYK